jgi:LPXTG-motif cell wall-anchored protein
MPATRTNLRHRVRTGLIAGAVALAALSVPTAAQASTIYPPAGSCTASPTTIQAGGTVTFECAAETFSSDEQVTITVTGENGSDASIGIVRFAISTASGTAQSGADGSLAGIPITLPSNATGTYNIAAVSPTSAGGTAAVTITDAEGNLPSTGMDSAAVTGLLIGGGALLVAGAALAITVAVRRSRSSR